MEEKKTIGIIGGMGPLATCDLFQKIIKFTEASSDQEHIHICIDDNTNIPDRTEAILGRGESPVSEMVKSGIRLEAMGADVLLMPCNTAHYFYDQLAAFLDVPLLSMPEETAEEIQRNGIKKVGLLATDGTIRAGVYTRALERRGIEVIFPSGEGQRNVMKVIYEGIKAGKKEIESRGVRNAVRELRKAGAETIILGCTELPIFFHLYPVEGVYIDPTAALARAAIRFVGGQCRG